MVDAILSVALMLSTLLPLPARPSTVIPQERPVAVERAAPAPPAPAPATEVPRVTAADGALHEDSSAR